MNSSRENLTSLHGNRKTIVISSHKNLTAERQSRENGFMAILHLPKRPRSFSHALTPFGNIISISCQDKICYKFATK